MAEKIKPIETKVNSTTNSWNFVREHERALLHQQYDLACQQIVSHMKLEDLAHLETEDDIIEAGVALTR